MSTGLKGNCDKLLLVFAFGLLAAGAIWVWLQQPALQLMRHQSDAVRLTGKEHVASVWCGVNRTTVNWSKPSVQSHGAGWLYDVFTPPVIYYNPIAKTFTITPPKNIAEGNGLVFGLELLAVKLEAYRLQLVGYFGAPGDYLAAFVSPGEPDILLAREGRHFDGLGLTLKNFTIKKIPVEHGDPWSVYDISAQAILLDERSGAEVTLVNGKCKFTDTPLAVLRLAHGTDQSRELHEGDTIKVDTSIYRVERIQLYPPEVVVARNAPGLRLPETKILRPEAVEKSTITGGNNARQSPVALRKAPAQLSAEFVNATANNIPK